MSVNRAATPASRPRLLTISPAETEASTMTASSNAARAGLRTICLINNNGDNTVNANAIRAPREPILSSMIGRNKIAARYNIRQNMLLSRANK